MRDELAPLPNREGRLPYPHKLVGSEHPHFEFVDETWRGRMIGHILAALRELPAEEWAKRGPEALDSPIPFLRSALVELYWTGDWPELVAELAAR